LSIKVDVAQAVKEGAPGGGVRQRWFSRTLVAVQIALSVVLLAGASISVQAFLQIRYRDAGFDMDNLLTVLMSLPSGEEVDRAALTASLVEKATSLPAVSSVAATDALPLLLRATSFSIDEKALAPDEVGPKAIVLSGTPEYLKTMGFALLRGRFFDRSDREETPAVAVLSQSVAERHWPQGDPLGRTITVQGRSRQVVGVVSDIRLNLFDEAESSLGAVYLPMAQQPMPEYNFLMIRSEIDPKALVRSLRDGLPTVDPRVSLGFMRTMDEWFDLLFSGDSFMRRILSGFGFLALLLAALGTYGVLAYTVAQRSREMGVRMALGADASRIFRMIIGQGAILGLIGLLVGVPGVIAAVRILESVLAYAPSVDSLTIVAVFVVLFLSTLLASWLPARRAAGLDPLVMLREE